MNNLKEIRWKQRFRNFEKSFKLLEKFIALKNPDETARAGGIQFFEMSLELAWKVLKGYLENEKYNVKSPGETIKVAFQVGLIDDGHSWIDGLDDRNLTVHTYNETTAIVVEERIRNKYYPLLKKLYKRLEKEL
jgi:nucleotidyltransferase substrate binding protein (TIGR01987 family)